MWKLSLLRFSFVLSMTMKFLAFYICCNYGGIYTCANYLISLLVFHKMSITHSLARVLLKFVTCVTHYLTSSVFKSHLKKTSSSNETGNGNYIIETEATGRNKSSIKGEGWRYPSEFARLGINRWLLWEVKVSSWRSAFYPWICFCEYCVFCVGLKYSCLLCLAGMELAFF